MRIAGVRFRDNWRIYDFDATDVAVAVGDDVIVESDRGLGFARVVRFREAERLPDVPQHGPEQKGREAARKEPERQEEEVEVEIEVETPGSIAAAAAAAANAPAAAEQPSERPRPPKGHRKVLRKATEDDVRKADKNREREQEAFAVCQGMIAERELPMKLIRAEYSFDASRVTFYFFSETRVDFRELVKDIAHKLRSRIEMRQVGVRDVARVIGGFGPCGRELCCTSFLKNFEPVSIRMAKKQEMVLNPAKISGVCGRLLCCLSYEFPVYDAIKKDIAEMKESAVREKREEEERKLADQRREAEEVRQAELKQRQEDDKRRQEQRQKQQEQRQKQQQEQKQRPAEQPKDGKKPQEKRKDGRPDQRQRQQQGRQQRDQQPGRPQQQPGPEQPPQQATVTAGAEQPQQQGEQGDGKKRKKRRFWRKKKGGGGGGSQPGGGGAPAGGGA